MKVLHAGCGSATLPPWFGPEVEEVRLDLAPEIEPDVLGSITAIPLPDDTFGAVHCSHTLEHLYPHEVAIALGEFYRVLQPGGFVLIMVPDLEDVRPTEEVLYCLSDGTQITGLDLIYGLRWCVEQSLFMAHHTGFTSGTMHRFLQDAGFQPIRVSRMAAWNLLAVGVK